MVLEFTTVPKKFGVPDLEGGQPAARLVDVVKLPPGRDLSGLLVDVEEPDLVVVADGDDRLPRHRREEGGGDGLGVADQRRHRRK